jgi:hypothetical protein
MPRQFSDGRSDSAPAEPSAGYAVALLIAASLVAIMALGPRSYLDRVRIFPDMTSYTQAANAVRHWRLVGAPARQFWGYAYAGVLASLVMPYVNMLVVLIVVSAIAGCVAVVLAHRLWGGWTAVYLTALGFPWIQRVAFGGSEPLFMALLFGALLAARRSSWVSAALFAALATTVRPIGVFAVVGVVAAALRERKVREVGLGLGVTTLVFAAYCIPLAATGDVFGNLHFYWPQFAGPSPIGLPFVALWRWAASAQVSPLRHIVFAAAIGVVVLAPFVAFRGDEQRTHWAENIFALGSSCFLITLNCLGCIWAFPRFAIVSLPFALVAMRRWLPRDERVVAVLSVSSALLAAAMQMNDLAPGTTLLHLFSLQ